MSQFKQFTHDDIQHTDGDPPKNHLATLYLKRCLSIYSYKFNISNFQPEGGN